MSFTRQNQYVSKVTNNISFIILFISLLHCFYSQGPLKDESIGSMMTNHPTHSCGQMYCFHLTFKFDKSENRLNIKTTKQNFPSFCFQCKPVKADAKHPILAECSYKEVDVLGSPSKGGQWTLLQGDLTHPATKCHKTEYICNKPASVPILQGF